tara:strand:- start:3 stop:482 length:480 start_codon:yes stop_codon:yes gene_type:complete
MNFLFELSRNELLFWSLVACISAQILKVLFCIVLEGKFRLGVIFETGGMPSSHSALITGVTSGIGWSMGFDNPIFAFAVAVSLIVMYDASGVRRSAGLQAKEFNKLASKLDEKYQTNLKENLGHTKLEVIVGSIIGPMITLPGIELLGSPTNLIRHFFS